MTVAESVRDAQHAEVLFAVIGRLGLITLNRPRAINALTGGMVTAMARQLSDWAVDDRVSAVAITGSGERGLCAGGDLVALYEDARRGDGTASEEFWREEYRLNAAIAHYPKPYVALMDGIVLGGGIGVSAHGSHRIVSERSRLGLPETGIGFVPDIGASWLLSRAPGRLGEYLALTAGSIGAADAIAIGLADSYVPSALLGRVLTALEDEEPDAVIARFAGNPPAAQLPDARTWVDHAFDSADAGEIIARLRAVDDPVATLAAASAADTIAAKSPTAVSVALESIRRARAFASLEEALDQEFRVSVRMLRTPDFVEGVRAQVIDKDRNPGWVPSAVGDVDAQTVASFFAPLGQQELGLAKGSPGVDQGAGR